VTTKWGPVPAGDREGSGIRHDLFEVSHGSPRSNLEAERKGDGGVDGSDAARTEHGQALREELFARLTGESLSEEAAPAHPGLPRSLIGRRQEVARTLKATFTL
jgi:hypothetical protein